MRWGRYLFLPLIPGIVLCQRRIDRTFGQFQAQERARYLWSARRVQTLAPGLKGLMADIYWLRTVQYFGGQRVFARDKRFELLRPLIEITIALDRRLEIAYRYGAIFLSEPWPAGAGEPEAGITLLERGVKALPHSWRLRQDLGFFRFAFLKDAKRASEELLEASKIPGAPYWLETLAAEVLVKGGDRETSRRIWRRMYEQAEEGAIKNNALFHLLHLDVLDALDALNRLVLTFESETGRRPRSLEELLRRGLLRAPPRDPAGVPFKYDPETRRFAIAPESPFWRPLASETR